MGKLNKQSITSIVFLSLGGLFLLIAILGRFIFNPGTLMYELSVESIGKFFDIIDFFETKLPAIVETLAIIVFLWLLGKAIAFILKLISVEGKKSKTIANIISSTIKYGLLLIGAFLVLSAWGVETPTLLASLGILGLAISFGAQNLIEDILAGLFIIFEDQFEINDIIQIDGFRGKVTEIGLRTTKFEDVNGDIKIINNSDIRGAINTTNKLSPAICDISVSYGANLKAVEDVIKANLDRIKKNIPHIIEGPFYFGVESLAESSVVLRIYSKCDEENKYSVRRQLNREMKLIFDENNIEIPFNQIVVHQVKEGQ
jgi:small conductance mechanosensitive channel